MTAARCRDRPTPPSGYSGTIGSVPERSGMSFFLLWRPRLTRGMSCFDASYAGPVGPE